MEKEKDDTEKKQIGFNLTCEYFKRNMIELINNSNLPIAPVYYIMRNLYDEVEKTYYATLNKESSENPIDFCTGEEIKDEEEENSD